VTSQPTWEQLEGLRLRLAREQQRTLALERTLQEVLHAFTQAGHPGRPCLRTGWIDVNAVARWRQTLTDASALADDG